MCGGEKEDIVSSSVLAGLHASRMKGERNIYSDELLLLPGLPGSIGCTNILVPALQAGDVQVTDGTEKVVIKGSALQRFIYSTVLL